MYFLVLPTLVYLQETVLFFYSFWLFTSICPNLMHNYTVNYTVLPRHITLQQNIHKPLYNTVHINMVSDVTMFKDGSQKCIDYCILPCIGRTRV